MDGLRNSWKHPRDDRIGFMVVVLRGRDMGRVDLAAGMDAAHLWVAEGVSRFSRPEFRNALPSAAETVGTARPAVRGDAEVGRLLRCL